MSDPERKQYKFGFTNRDSSQNPKKVVEHIDKGRVMVTSMMTGYADTGVGDNDPALKRTIAPSPRYHTKAHQNNTGNPGLITVLAAYPNSTRHYNGDSTGPPTKVPRSPVDQSESNTRPSSRQSNQGLDGTRKSTSQLRGKTVSIPRTRLIEAPNKLVRRKPLFYKHSSEEAPFVTYMDPLAKSRLHISEYIRTVYRECEEDKDAMNITFQTALSRIQDSDHLGEKPLPKQLARISLLAQTGQPVPKCEAIDICDSVPKPNRNFNDNNNSIDKGLLVVAPAISNRFPRHRTRKLDSQQQQVIGKDEVTSAVRGRMSDFSVLTSKPNALLRKTWRLAVSRPPAKSDPLELSTDVFITGTNIHPITDHPKLKSTSEIDNKFSRSPTGSVEMLKLSFPIFQYNSGQAAANTSQQCPWQDQEPLMALGRPKSVNTRSSRRSVRSASPDRQNRRRARDSVEKTCQRYGVTPRFNDQEGLDVGSRPDSGTVRGKGVCGLEEDEAYVSSYDTDSSQDALINSEQTDTGKGPKVSEDASVDPVLNTTPNRRQPKTAENVTDTLGKSVLEQDSLRRSREPTLRQSKQSAKMQGISSDVRERLETRTETTVQQPESGARHKILKPMFDRYDYEDFQHKKYQSFNRRNNKRSPPDPNGVHYLRVNIGDQ